MIEITPTIVAVAAGTAVGSFILAIALGSRQRERLETRLEQYAAVAQRLRQREQGRWWSPRRLLSGFRRRDKLATQKEDKAALLLGQADLKLTPAEYALIRFASVLGLAFLAAVVLHHPAFAPAGAVLGYVIPRAYVGRRIAARRQRFEAQLGEALMLLANAVRAGYGFSQALDHAAEELDPPISTEFRRVVQEEGLGLSLDAALDNLVSRIRSPDLELMVSSVKVQREVGGNLAETLSILAHTIRERVRIQGEIRVLTAEQRFSSYILTLLPLGLLFVLQSLNPEYMRPLFTTLYGWTLLALMGTGMIVAHFILGRIASIRV